MCEPTSIAVVSAMVVAAATSAYSSYSAQKAQNKAADYNAKIQEHNAQVSELMAQQTEAQGEKDVLDQARQVNQFKSQQRSAFAGSGVDINSGSALDSVQNTSDLAYEDALTIKYNSKLDAWGYRNQGTNYMAEANLSRLQKRNPWEVGGTTLLSQGSSYAASYYGNKAANRSTQKS